MDSEHSKRKDRLKYRYPQQHKETFKNQVINFKIASLRLRSVQAVSSKAITFVNHFFRPFYLKNESTNSNLLNTCKSSIPSPTPIYLTGI